MEFDEKACTDFINNSLASAGIEKYDSDELLNVVDMIWDFYESRGYLDPDFDDDSEDPEPEQLELDITDYVTRMLRRDKLSEVKPEHVTHIVKAELAYEKSLEQ